MTNRRSTKRALFTSVVSLLLCFSMLLGTTFAWFTDSVSSANNIITSGNLDIELYYQKTGETGWTKVTESTNIFKENALWEPGYTEVVKLKVVNEGTLALKYNLGVNVASEIGSVNVNGQPFKLSDFIKYAVVNGADTYTRDTAIAAAENAGATFLNTAYNSGTVGLPVDDEATADVKENEKIVTMVVYMPESVGNDANYAKGEVVPTIKLGINLLATQLAAEEDSFDENYDANAMTFVKDTAEAQAALDNATAGTIIKLAPGVKYGTLYLRPYAGGTATKDVDWIGNNYGWETYTLFENLTIVGADGATVNAIEIEGGTYYHTKHSQNDAYPVMLSLIELKNIVIDGVTFTGKGGYDPQGYGNVINLSGGNIKVNGLTLKNCVLDNASNNARLIYKTEATTNVHNYSYGGETFTFSPTLKDITVTGCTFNGGYMGLELRETENVTITNNVFNVGDRNILLATNTGCTYTGEITITGNVSNNAKERFVRADGTGDAVVDIKDNVINSYMGADVDYIKVTNANANKVTVENNTITYGWNGVIPTVKPESLVVDTNAKVIYINDAAALAYLNTLLNDANFATNYGDKWTYRVELKADIDLGNKAWTPINLSNVMSFNGNGHTIKNLKVAIDGNNAGFFGSISCNDLGDIIIENFTIDGATVSGKEYVGVVSGGSVGTLKNITVINATVNGTKYVGGLAGRGSNFINCAVKDSTVTSTGKTVGGLVGYAIYDNSDNTLVGNNKGNLVENVIVTGAYNVGGMLGQAQNVLVEDNTVKNVTVISTQLLPANASSNEVLTAEVAARSAFATTVIGANTVENVKCENTLVVYGLKLTLVHGNAECYGTITVTDKAGLLNLAKLNEDWNTLFSDGNGVEYQNYPINNFYYDWTWSIILTTDIDFGGEQIQPIDLGKRVVFDGQGYTIKNVVIVTDATTENEAGLFIANDCGVKNLKLDNIQVTGSNVGNSTVGVVSGSCNMPLENITVTNSSAIGGKYTGGIVGYGYTTIKNCTVENTVVKGGYKLGGLIGYICASTANGNDVIGNTVTDSTVNGIGNGVYAGGKTEYVIGKLVGNYNCNGDCNNNTVTNMTTSATENIGKIEAGNTVNQ